MFSGSSRPHDPRLEAKGENVKKLFAAGAAMSLLFSTQPANAQCNAGGGPPFSVFEVKAGHYNDLGVNGGGVLWAIGANGVELIFQSYQTSGCRVPSNLFYPG